MDSAERESGPGRMTRADRFAEYRMPEEDIRRKKGIVEPTPPRPMPSTPGQPVGAWQRFGWFVAIIAGGAAIGWLIAEVAIRTGG